MIDAPQCRAARGLLSWSQGDLVDQCGLSAATIRAFERGGPMRDSNRNLLRMTFERAGVLFIPEDRHGPGVRLLRTAAFEAAVAALVDLHGSSVPLDKVEVIAGHCSDEDRGGLSLAFGDRAWGRDNLPTDERGREIQDRLVRVGRFALS